VGPTRDDSDGPTPSGPEPAALELEIDPPLAVTPAPAALPAGEPDRLTVRLDPTSAVWLVAGILVLFFGAAFLGTATRSLTVILVGVLLAFAIEPLVLSAERRLHCRRSIAVGVVGLGLGVALGLLLLLVGPAAVRQAQDFGDELPQTLQQAEDLPLIGDRLAEAEFATRAQEWIDTLPGRLGGDGVENAARTVFNGLVDALGVLLVAVVVLIDGPRLVSRGRMLVPVAHRERADRVGRVFYRVVGTYFAGSLLVATIGGTWVLTVGLLVGVPLAPVAAVWYAVVSLIPQIGGFLGTSFVTLLALTQGVVPALIVLVLVVGYMNLENYVITPAIVGEAVDLSPPVTMLAALVGGAAFGVPGALAATPLCGTVKALYQEARHGETFTPPSRLRDRVKVPGPIAALLRKVRGGDDG
jgi:predicted PurR-regulated permease PerM